MTALLRFLQIELTKFRMLSISLVLSFVVMAFPLQSQTQYCYPDCDTSLWVPNPPLGAYTFGMTLPCGEPVLVFYRIRYACNAWWDIFIERVMFVNGQVGGEQCGLSMTLAQMLENIMEQMLVQNPMNFPPRGTQDSCADNYRVMVGACWIANFPIAAGGITGLTKIIQPDSPAGFLNACHSIRCCLQAYTVCIVSGQRVITYKPQLSVPGICDPINPPACTPVCK